MDDDEFFGYAVPVYGRLKQLSQIAGELNLFFRCHPLVANDHYAAFRGKLLQLVDSFSVELQEISAVAQFGSKPRCDICVAQ